MNKESTQNLIFYHCKEVRVIFAALLWFQIVMQYVLLIATTTQAKVRKILKKYIISFIQYLIFHIRLPDAKFLTFS